MMNRNNIQSWNSENILSQGGKKVAKVKISHLIIPDTPA